MTEEVKYYKTDEYEKFSFFKFNRTAGTNKNLKDSVKMVDMTKFCPIIVTPDFKIIDGQNRFIVCKNACKPIFYTVYNGDPKQAMIALNTSSKPWRQEEYLEYYVGEGRTNYMALKFLMDKYKISISNAILLYSSGKTNSASFKKGNLVDDSEYFIPVVEFIQNTELPKDVKSYRSFVNAVLLFFINNNGNYKKINKLSKYIISITKFSRTEDYLQAFENLTR